MTCSYIFFVYTIIWKKNPKIVDCKNYPKSTRNEKEKVFGKKQEKLKHKDFHGFLVYLDEVEDC